MKNRAFVLASAAAALCLGACQTTASADLTEASVRSAMSDRTAITGEGATGWQAEYAAPDGSLYVINPRAPAVMNGTWSVRTKDLRSETGPVRQVQVCYTFADSHGEGPPRLGEEKCGDARYPLGLAGEIKVRTRKGDAFGLARGAGSEIAAGPAPAWP